MLIVLSYTSPLLLLGQCVQHCKHNSGVISGERGQGEVSYPTVFLLMMMLCPTYHKYLYISHTRRGLLAQSVIRAQASSPTFTHVYAGLVAIVNTKFPQTGELIARRLLVRFRKGFRRNDKVCGCGGMLPRGIPITCIFSLSSPLLSFSSLPSPLLFPGHVQCGSEVCGSSGEPAGAT